MFDVIKKQEETRQIEFTSKGAEFKAMQAQAETVCFILLHQFLILSLFVKLVFWGIEGRKKEEHFCFTFMEM